MNDRLHFQLQRQKEHLPGHVIRFAGPYHKLQVTDTTTDRDVELVRVDHTPKRLSLPLALHCLDEQVVLGKEYPVQLCRTVQQVGIMQLAPSS